MARRGRRVGDWAKIKENLQTLQPTLVESINKWAGREADYFLKLLQDNIKGQKLDFRPLNPQYVAFKERNGLSTKTLISTGEYVEKLTVVKSEQGNLVSYFIGAYSEDEHEASGHTMDVIARWLEYGTVNMPPIPHLNPSWEMYKHTFRRRLYKEVDKLLRRAWR